jgi:hypothetical protein
MEYGLNKINIRLFTQEIKDLNSILGIQGTNFTCDIHYGQHWNIDRILYLPRLARLCDYLGEVYVHKFNHLNFVLNLA